MLQAPACKYVLGGHSFAEKEFEPLERHALLAPVSAASWLSQCQSTEVNINGKKHTPMHLCEAS